MSSFNWEKKASCLGNTLLKLNASAGQYIKKGSKYQKEVNMGLACSNKQEIQIKQNAQIKQAGLVMSQKQKNKTITLQNTT